MGGVGCFPTEKSKSRASYANSCSPKIIQGSTRRGRKWIHLFTGVAWCFRCKNLGWVTSDDTGDRARTSNYTNRCPNRGKYRPWIMCNTLYRHQKCRAFNALLATHDLKWQPVSKRCTAQNLHSGVKRAGIVPVSCKSSKHACPTEAVCRPVITTSCS